jgi:hypothetical protein
VADAPWFSVAVDYWRNPKVAQAGFLAASLNLAALAYCSEQLTDGYVPSGAARILAAPMHGYVWVGEDGQSVTPRDVFDSRWQHLADVLVAADLWEPVEGGWVIVNYLDHQPSRAQVEARREQAREAGRIGGQKRAANRTAKQTASEPLSGSLSEASSETPSGSVAPVPVPVPVPVPTEVQEQELFTADAVAPRALALVPPHDPVDDLFAEWWDTVPKKEQRKKARAAYAVALRKVGPSVLLDGMRNYKALVTAQGRESRYVLHPTSWLNGARWEDETETRPQRPAFGVSYTDADRAQPSAVLTAEQWQAQSARKTS